MVTLEQLAERSANEQEWRNAILARLDKLESNQRWLIGLMVLLLIALVGGLAGVIAALIRLVE